MEGRENTISCIQGILRKQVKEAGQKKEVLRQLRNPGPVYIKLMFMRYTGVWLKIFLRLALEQEAGSDENKTQIGWGWAHGIHTGLYISGLGRGMDTGGERIVGLRRKSGAPKRLEPD